jgi:hypothetical protein
MEDSMNRGLWFSAAFAGLIFALLALAWAMTGFTDLSLHELAVPVIGTTLIAAFRLAAMVTLSSSPGPSGKTRAFYR